MGARTGVRRLVVAALAGVLVGGGLMAVTPVGAEVHDVVATNWKKIWKKEIRPLADKRYYTKAKSDRRYAKKRSVWTKAESDARYAPAPRTVSGIYVADLHATEVHQLAATEIDFGRKLADPPQVRIVRPGFEPPQGCSGSITDPSASPGFVCIFPRTGINVDEPYTNYCATPDTGCLPYSGRMGLFVLARSATAGYMQASGSWALGLPPGS